VAIAKSENITSATAKAAAIRQAKNDLKSDLNLAKEQYKMRIRVSDMLGGAAYDPAIKPEDFVSGVSNPCFTLIPGMTFVYEKKSQGQTERVEVTVTSETKVIMGVTCMVVMDSATVDGELVEDTIDWYAQDKAGNVWYFGEISRQYEDGDLVSLQGSWKAGVNGAKPGIVMAAHPNVNEIHRQEFAPAVAEDMSQVAGLNQTARMPFGVFRDCLETVDFTAIDAGKLELKFFSPTVGQVVLTIDAETGEREELVEILY